MAKGQAGRAGPSSPSGPSRHASVMCSLVIKQTDLLSGIETHTVDTSLFFTKKSNVAKCFFDISNSGVKDHEIWTFNVKKRQNLSKKKLLKNINLGPHFL